MKTDGVLVRASYQVGRRLFGQVPTPQKLMAERPAMMLGLGGLWTAIEYGGTLDRALRALLQLHVATVYGVPYWMDIRHAVGVKAGIPEAKLGALEDYERDASFTARERAALAYAEAIVRDDRQMSDALEAGVREHFSDAERLELTFVVGYQVFASKFAKAYRLEPQGFSAR